MNYIETQAAGQYLADLTNYTGSFIQLLTTFTTGDPPEEISIWEPFENHKGEEIADLIAAAHQNLQQTLEYAKSGIIEAAINDNLPLDFSTLDMEHMVDIGLAKA